MGINNLNKVFMTHSITLLPHRKNNAESAGVDDSITEA